MEKITIICTVCAEFKNGNEIFGIEPKDRGVILEAPAWIRKTLMFRGLEVDGSISYVDRSNRKQAENDPLAGVNAEGKREHLMTVGGQEKAIEAETEAPAEPVRKRAPRKKKDDAE